MSQHKQPTKLAIFVKIALLAALLTTAETSTSKAEDNSIIESFRPPVEFDSKEIAVSEMAVRHFDFIGEVFLVSSDGDRIVVYDTSFDMAPGLRIKGIREGMTVGLKFNNNREVVVVERLNLSNK